MRRLLMAVCFVASAVAVVVVSGCGGDTGPTGSSGTAPGQLEKEKRR